MFQSKSKRLHREKFAVADGMCHCCQCGPMSCKECEKRKCCMNFTRHTFEQNPKHEFEF